MSVRIDSKPLSIALSATGFLGVLVLAISMRSDATLVQAITFALLAAIPGLLALMIAFKRNCGIGVWWTSVIINCVWTACAGLWFLELYLRQLSGSFQFAYFFASTVLFLSFFLNILYLLRGRTIEQVRRSIGKS